jgi:hypothetical protein
MDPTFKGLAAPVPKSAKPPKFPVKVVLLVLGFLMLTMIAYVMLTSYFEGNGAYAPLQLGLRMDTVAKMAKDATPNIKDPDFSKVNSEISNILASDNGSIQRILPTGKNDPTSKQYRSAERSRGLKLTEELKTARINGVFDAKYKSILREEIVSLQKAAKRLAKNSSKEFKAILTTFIDHADTAIYRLDSLK